MKAVPTITNRRWLRQKVQLSTSEKFRNISLGIAGIVSSILIPVIGLYYTSRDKEREVSKDFVEIATKILSDTPTPSNRPLREWAISLIDHYSALPLPEDARSALLEDQPLFSAPSSLAVPIQKLQALKNSGWTLGVSLSSHSGQVDFNLLKQHDVQFAYIRVSQGTSFVDQMGIQNAKLAKENGIKVGLYHFFVPGKDVNGQFVNFSKALDTVQWDLPPTIDCEPFMGAPIPTDYATQIEQFASLLQNRYGIKPIIYTMAAFGTQNLSQTVSKYPLFIAQMGSDAPSIPKWWSDYQFWHLAVGVGGDPAFKNYDIIAFKGSPDALAQLSVGRK